MSEINTENTAPETSTQAPDPAAVNATDQAARDACISGTPGDEAERTQGRKAAAEAKKYRHRLREAEAALEAANNRVDVLQTAEVERLAKEHGIAKPSSIWLSGMTLDGVRDQHGNIDHHEAVNQIRAAEESLGLANNAPVPPNPAQIAQPSDIDDGHGWNDSFRI